MSDYSLKVVDIGINTHQEPVVYMREDCHVCRSEGFTANTRVLIKKDDNSVIATVNVVDEVVIQHGQAGFSKIALQRLNVKSGDVVQIKHAPVLSSLSTVRKKLYGHPLNNGEFYNIIKDISAHRYSDIEIASFLSACIGNRLNLNEIISLTNAMVDCGKRLLWPEYKQIFDKHCIGGLPGNRTTPLVVAITSAAGLVMPKTSSRAITSPAGTADTMETLTAVNLSLPEIQRVVRETGACLAWGGAVNLSPADDLLIRIERALDLDGEGQLIASVLSKKIAAGSTHAIIDIPVGETAKVRSRADADRLSALFTEVGNACGIHIRCLITDGSQPIGRGIGPVEEARDIIEVLQGNGEHVADLRERALFLAAHLIDMAENTGINEAKDKATSILDSGRAWEQFKKIVDAQGGLKELPSANYAHTVCATENGYIKNIDCRQIARLAKLAGAPFSPAAGLRLHVTRGDTVEEGQPLFTLYSDSEGEKDYALDYYQSEATVFFVEPASD